MQFATLLVLALAVVQIAWPYRGASASIEPYATTLDGVEAAIARKSHQLKTHPTSHQYRLELASLYGYYAQFFVQSKAKSIAYVEKAVRLAREAKDSGQIDATIAFAQHTLALMEIMGPAHTLHLMPVLRSELQHCLDRADTTQQQAMCKGAQARLYALAPPYPVSIGDRIKAQNLAEQALVLDPRQLEAWQVAMELAAEQRNVSQMRDLLDHWKQHFAPKSKARDSKSSIDLMIARSRIAAMVPRVAEWRTYLESAR